jgi:hypothetical protein
MQAFAGRNRGLPISSLIAASRFAAILVIVAILLGRSTFDPRPPARCSPRQPASPRYLGLDRDCFAEVDDGVPHLLDTETGNATPFPVPEQWGVGRFACSPWRDAEDRYHLVGRCLDRATGTYLLLRRTFPPGGAIGRLALDVLPFGLPCWAPDRGDRVLFAGSDRRLYLAEFPEVEGPRCHEPTPPRPILWRAEPPGEGAFWLQDPCWPSDPALGGRLLVALDHREDVTRPGWITHLWWLQLSPDGGAIVAAGRAIAPDESGPRRDHVAEWLPRVGTSHDGTPLLAYLAQERGETDWELWVMPIEPATAGRGPRVRASAGRKRAEGCATTLPPTFSADGRFIYTARPAGDRYRVECVPVDVPSIAAGQPAPRPSEASRRIRPAGSLGERLGG